MLKPIQLDENTLILDTETTGLGSTAEICEISIIDGLGNVVFDSLIKPINYIPDEVIKIHGITNEMVADAPSFEDIYSQILLILFPFPSNKTVIIYNKMYDLKILKQVSVMCNMAHISHEPFEAIDNYTLCAMRYYSEFKNQAKWSKLTDACINMGIDISQFSAHRALGDCQMTLELIRCMNDPNYIKTIKKKEKAMIIEKPQTALSEVIFDIKFTPSIINFDETEFNNSISAVIEPVKNLGNDLTKEVLTVTLANLRKFQKQISDRRIAIVKDIKAPITEFEAKIKKGDAEIEQYINKYDASLKVILAKEKVTKHAEIEKMLPDIIINNKLDKDHAAKLTILEDYYLVKWIREKIIVDLVKRAEELFKQQDYVRVQDELRNTQIESRARLIEQLNASYGLNFTYAKLPINIYDDNAVNEFYRKARIEQLEAITQKPKEDTEKQIPVAMLEEVFPKSGVVTYKEVAPVPKEAWDELSVEEKCHTPYTQKISHANNDPVEIEALREPYKSQVELSNKEVVKIKYIYQNLRLGAASQAQILAAVAKLKVAGVSVEFI